MNLDKYLSTQENQKKFSKRTGIPMSSLSFWRHGKRPVPFERCPQIEAATKGMVTRRELCPDNWQELWPELAERSKPSEKVA